MSNNPEQAKERLDHEQYKKTNEFIKKLRKRPVKQNIDVAKHEYQIVFNQLQRKQKLVPQYQIDKEIDELQRSRGSDEEEEVPMKKTIFQLEDERIKKKE